MSRPAIRGPAARGGRGPASLVRRAAAFLDTSPGHLVRALFVNKPRSLCLSLVWGYRERRCARAVLAQVGGRPQRLSSAVPGMLVLASERTVWKISCRVGGLERERSGLEWLAGNPGFGSIAVPVRWETLAGYPAMRMPRMTPVTDEEEHFEAAWSLLRRLQACGEIRRGVSIAECARIPEGLTVIGRLCGAGPRQQCARIIEETLGAGGCAWGPVHGDFHMGNVVKGRRGEYRLLDFDCFRQQDLQALDAISFLAEHCAATSGRGWPEQLLSMIDGTEHYTERASTFMGRCGDVFRPAWLLLYFVDRIGQNRSYVNDPFALDVRAIRRFVAGALRRLA